MKEKSIIRSAQLGQNAQRSLGDAPSLGRVPKMPGTGLPRQRRSSSKGKHGRTATLSRSQRENSQIIRIWSFLLLLGSIGILCFSIWYMTSRRLSQAGPASKNRSFAAEGLASTGPARVAARVESLPEVEALKLVRSALHITEASQVEKFFRLESTNAQQVVDFLTATKAQKGEILTLKWRGNTSGGLNLVDEVVVHFEKPESKKWLILLAPDSTGSWKIDFDALAMISTPPIRELIEKNLPSAKVRAVVSPDNYYNGVFKDDQEWLCCRFLFPDQEEAMLYGYCRISSAQGKAVQRALGGDKRPSRALLEIRRVEGAQKNQFEIARFISTDWVTPETPFDEKN